MTARKGTTKARRPILERIREMKPAEMRVALYLDYNAVQAFNLAEAEQAEAAEVVEGINDHTRPEFAERSRTRLDEADKALAKAQKALDEHTATFTLRGIGRPAFDALMRKHPPTKEQDTKHRKENKGAPATINEDTFRPALIGASIVEIDGEEEPLSDEEVTELLDNLNEGDVVQLYIAAQAVNMSRRTNVLGN
jgi:hypothetical protein